PVLHDLRSADVAAGGHGAPLAPLLDQLLLGADERGRTAVLNIGGISNLSLVGGVAGDEVLCGGLGPGNALLDAAVHAATGRAACWGTRRPPRCAPRPCWPPSPRSPR